MASSRPVKKLTPYVHFSPVCPEVEIGLGIPRHPVRLILKDGKPKLVQPATNEDATERMKTFVNSFLTSVKEVDGFVLKSRSPSCGVKDVKIYSGSKKGMAATKGQGFFGGAVLEAFPHLPVEDEGRLTNFRIREHFLTQLFTLAGFRQIKSLRSMRELVRFQTENKYLLMAYNQRELRILGRIVANQEKRPIDLVITDYERHLWNAFSRPPRDGSNINVSMHALGHFSRDLSASEKEFFLNVLEEYRDERVPLSVPLNVLKSWAARFKDDYLMKQTFIGPYPRRLMEITDSGKGRNL
jgi:uncharacterized protein YbgA (DUF1722 family)/uncharacterized protein YbbK (DUF523 family)